MNSEKLTSLCRYVFCINCGRIIEHCECRNAPYFTECEVGWGSKWEEGESIKITIKENKTMYCTERELKEWIETLAEKVDDIEETVSALGRAINSVPNLSVLEKRGVHSFIEDIGKQITAYKDLSTDVKNFTITKES